MQVAKAISLDLRRRTFLQRCGLLLLAMVPRHAHLGPAQSPGASRERGHARNNIRDFNAIGDGVNDDTDAFQDAIDALPNGGGTVEVPPGTYLIDPTRSVRLRSQMHLKMSPAAKLVAKSNAAEKAYVLLVYKVSDVEISGGRIIGDRDNHLGTTGEWGHGVQVRGGSRVTIRDVHVSRCWGDGICIGGAKAMPGDPRVVPSSDVLVARVVCTGNRRQGLTIGRSRHVRVQDSEFSNTYGTLPSAGIDVEPDAGDIARDVLIENCVVRNNRGPGIQLYKRVSDVVIRRCIIQGNGAWGIFSAGVSGAVIADNHIGENGRTGIALRGSTTDVEIRGNEFRIGARAHGHGTAPGKAPWAAQIDVGKDARAIKVGADNSSAG